MSKIHDIQNEVIDEFGDLSVSEVREICMKRYADWKLSNVMNVKKLIFEERICQQPKETYFTSETPIGDYFIFERRENLFERPENSGMFGEFLWFGNFQGRRCCANLPSKEAAIEACQTHFENLIKSCLIL